MDREIIETSASMQAGLRHDTGEFQVYQDEKPFIEQAKMEREAGQKKDLGYKKFCTIPDIVAIDILYKYGIDIHAQTFMHDSDKVKKVMTIIKSEYPYLLSY